MQFFKSILTLSALVALSSAVALERNDPAHEQVSIVILTDSNLPMKAAPVTTSKACEKADLEDCSAFCATFEEKEICVASGDKVTCRCKPEKKSSGCQNCLLCLDP